MLRICSFESRKNEEMRSLVVRLGGQPTVVPSMREVPIGDHTQVFEFAKQLFSQEIDVIILQTGVGAKTLLETLETRFDRPAIVSEFEKSTVVIRGPKPQVVLRDWGIKADFRAAEPNTWREVLRVIDAEVPISAKTVAVQEYGESNTELIAELENREAVVQSVSIYRWALPIETGPLRDSIQSAIAGEFDVFLFTSAQQVNHALQIAEEMGVRSAWLNVLRDSAVCSIGPTCSERLNSFGISVDLEPSHPKMGHLVRESIEQAPNILVGKRTG